MGLKFLRMQFKKACRVQASDLHIVPRQKDVAVQLRIGKDLMTRQCIEKEFGENLSHISNFSIYGHRRETEATEWFVVFAN